MATTVANMTQPAGWEYKIVTVGGALTGAKDEVVEAKLNELGLEGWEAVNVFLAAGGMRVTIVVKRPLTDTNRRRRARGRELERT